MWRTLIVVCWAGAGFCGQTGLSDIDAEAQEKVAQLLQKVIQEYWNRDINTNAANGIANSTNVEAAFREASALMPERLDLRFGIASTLVSQALQTNGLQLECKLNGALQVYQQIQALDTNGFEAPILYAAYSRAIGRTNESSQVVTQLLKLHPARTQGFLEKFDRVDSILRTAPNQIPSKAMPKNSAHAILVLGAGLETNGTIKARLLSRLEQGLKLARMYRRAPVIVTGGNQKSGLTEAYTMSRWLSQRGVSSKRLILEDKARDTVENALFSSAILQRLGVTHVTMVTSFSHIHRGLADLQEACLLRGQRLQYGVLAAKIKSEAEVDPVQESLSVYRDLMRVSGIWSYPGIQR